MNEGVYKQADGRHIVTPVAVDADGDTRIVDGGIVPLGYQQLTALTASTALTVPAGARLALIQADGADLRWRDDGVDPTATVGMILRMDSELVYNGDLAALRVIAISGSPILNVCYWG